MATARNESDLVRAIVDALWRLRGTLFVGVTERFDEALFLFGEQAGGALGLGDLTYCPQNLVLGAPPKAAHSAKSVAFMESRNRLDAALFQAAEVVLDRRLACADRQTPPRGSNGTGVTTGAERHRPGHSTVRLRSHGKDAVAAGGVGGGERGSAAGEAGKAALPVEARFAHFKAELLGYQSEHRCTMAELKGQWVPPSREVSQRAAAAGAELKMPMDLRSARALPAHLADPDWALNNTKTCGDAGSDHRDDHKSAHKSTHKRKNFDVV